MFRSVTKKIERNYAVIYRVFNIDYIDALELTLRLS